MGTTGETGIWDVAQVTVDVATSGIVGRGRIGGAAVEVTSKRDEQTFATEVISVIDSLDCSNTQNIMAAESSH